MASTKKPPSRLEGIDQNVRLRELPGVVGVCTKTITTLEKKGEFPQRKYITGKVYGYLRSEIDQWLAGKRSW